MRHLLICRDFPPAHAGGIGVYTWNLAHLLAEEGEIVHVVAEECENAPHGEERLCGGNLTVHRITFRDWRHDGAWRAHPLLTGEERLIHESCAAPAVLFGWHATALIERLVEEEGIDVIEASEYEAPLYFFLLRRALDLGPRRHPPCIIQIHSPTELLSQFNDEDALAPYRLYAIRHEEYCIRAADALLCPSHAMKQWAAGRYGLNQEDIAVIPLPVGDVSFVERSEDVWENGTVAFVGRLQACKGVLEFIPAAVEVARENPAAVFEIYGGDTTYLAARNRSVLSILQDMVPKNLRKRFHFHGEVERGEMLRQLCRARIGLVPSRWENFPCSCVELMASGLPVLGANHGGIPEIVKAGESGWLIQGEGVSALSDALRQTLSLSADQLKAMGQAAANHIRTLCNNKEIAVRQIEWRRSVAKEGAGASVQLLSSLPRPNRNGHLQRVFKQDTSRSGIAIAIPCYNQGMYLRDCLESIRRQTVTPVMTIIVNDGSDDRNTMRHLREFENEGWKVLHKKNGGLVSARNAGINAILHSGHAPLGIICIDSDDRLRPDFVERSAHVLANSPEVGIVSCWVRHFESADRIWMKPCPSFPYQWTTNEIATFSAVRTEALLDVGLYQLEMHQGCYADWDLFNAVLAAGWAGVTIPEILGEYRVRDDSILRRLNAHAHGRMRRAMFNRFRDGVAEDAIDVALLSEAADSWILREEVFTLRAQVARARSFIRRPDRAFRWLARKVLRKGEKIISRWNM